VAPGKTCVVLAWRVFTSRQCFCAFAPDYGADGARWRFFITGCDHGVSLLLMALRTLICSLALGLVPGSTTCEMVYSLSCVRVVSHVCALWLVASDR